MSTLLRSILMFALTAAQPYGVSLQGDLTSDDLRIRGAAVRQLDEMISQTPEVLGDGEMQIAIVTLLESENARIRNNYMAVVNGQSESLPEGYGDHYSLVLRAADRLRMLLSPMQSPIRARLLRALVGGAYNPDSPFAIRLSKEGDHIVEPVLEIAASTNEPERWNAQALIALLFDHSSAGSLHAPLSLSSKQALKQAARAGLSDPMPAVRRHAIDAVVAAHDREAVPMLIRLAETDPDAEGPMDLSVRARASKAIVTLKR